MSVTRIATTVIISELHERLVAIHALLVSVKISSLIKLNEDYSKYLEKYNNIAPLFHLNVRH